MARCRANPGLFSLAKTFHVFWIVGQIFGKPFHRTGKVAGEVVAGNLGGRGLLEQMVQVQNTGANPVQAVRLVVAGLTNQLYNASGTNNAQPFVVYPVSLATGANVGLRLQYNPRLPFPFTNGQLHVYEVPTTVLNYTPPPVASS